MTIRNEKKMVKYLYKTPKGVFTYNFFELEKIEIDTLNSAQGIDPAGKELSADIPEEVAEEAKSLIDRL